MIDIILFYSSVGLHVPFTCQLDHFLFTERNPYYIPDFLLESHITYRIAYYNQLNRGHHGRLACTLPNV